MEEQNEVRIPAADAPLWAKRGFWANQVAAREGKKHQAQIGDVREILKLLVTMEVEHMAKTGSADGGPVGVLRAEANAQFVKDQQAARKVAKQEKVDNDA